MNWLSGFSSATDTPVGDDDVIATDVSLSPNSKLPLTSTKSAPESLIVEPVVPAGKPDEASSVSASGVVPSGSVVAAQDELKPVTQLPSARPSKCR